MSEVEEMLSLKNWAVVGATDNKEKFGYKIFKVMKEAGYNVIPVNPGISEILGDRCYAALKDLPVKPDAVDMVVPPKVGEQVLRECAELGIKNVWLQPGANADSVVALAKELGMTVVADRCVMVEIRNR
ncbi:MAG TPA: CoA-binding protein [Patescibacteria group bacterium]|nr:CoA-binding protein [Patescibacteria group bacterium]